MNSVRGAKLEFSDWRLAFEVDLTMAAHKSIPGVSHDSDWYHEFTKSPAYTHGAADKDFRHICIDLRCKHSISALFRNLIVHF